MTDHHDFVIKFMQDHKRLITSIVKRYLIPNRYNSDDVRQYISIKILGILQNKETKNSVINDPEKYFKSCIEYYCIEFQRMNGFVFNLPGRPRKNCELEEATIKEKGFKYIGDITTEESKSLLSYSDDTEVDDSSWCYLTGLLSDVEAQVIDCVFRRNMTWSQTAKELGVARSTCWFRKTKALEKIKDHIIEQDGRASDSIRNILRMGDELIDD